MEPLPKGKYKFVIDVLKDAAINTLFARFVAEKKVSGKVLVDDADSPSTFYIIHPYGMTLLIGHTENEKFNADFVDYALNKKGERSQVEWMQAYPTNWDLKLKDLFKDSLIKYEDNLSQDGKDMIEVNTRVNFQFNRDKYMTFKARNISNAHKIVRTDERYFHKMKGTVVPSNFWDNADDFNDEGVGFSLIHDDKLAATAFSSYIFEKELELGMETFPDYRGKGYGQHVCSALIDFALANQYEPIWSCKLENIPSYNLAQKLGFEPYLRLPYYRLNV
jgi:GNAT superfamily N-acetyltransferase